MRSPWATVASTASTPISRCSLAVAQWLVEGHVIVAAWLAIFVVACVVASLGQQGGSGVHWDNFGKSPMAASRVVNPSNARPDEQFDAKYREMAGDEDYDGIRPAPTRRERVAGLTLAMASLASSGVVMAKYPYLIVFMVSLVAMGVGATAGFTAPAALAVRRTRRARRARSSPSNS